MSSPASTKAVPFHRSIYSLVLVFALCSALNAQTYTVLHKFTGGADGGNPHTGLTMDQAGTLYGTTAEGFLNGGTGTVFSLSHTGAGWTLNPLYTFAGGSGGYRPLAGVVFGADGSLYGTTQEGGIGTPNRQPDGCYLGCGTVFNLKLSGVETEIHRFAGGRDGMFPETGSLIFDRAGNLYGTTQNGGLPCDNPGFGCGTVFKLSPSGGGWTETVLYRFSGGSDGSYPNAGLIMDVAGNLYGTTVSGGVSGPTCFTSGCGTVFKLSPSGSGWTESTLYSFTGNSDGSSPYAGLILDAAGNLYGGTYYTGAVFQLMPAGSQWTLHVLHAFYPNSNGPLSNLVMDRAGNLYGSINQGGQYGGGNIFKLTAAGGSWTYTSLHDFCPGADCSEGGDPWSVILDANGNLYGTGYIGGINNNGVVWEITP